MIDHYVQETIAELKKGGFSGEDIFLSAHSLGGEISQDYVLDKSEIKGQILMGSSLLRSKRKINEDGKTIFDGYKTPTLTLFGLKDGLMRVSRGAEAFWHQELNIDESQKGMFPVVVLDKASHASFIVWIEPCLFLLM